MLDTRTSADVNTRALLLPYLLVLIAATVAVQVVVVLVGGRLTPVVAVLTGATGIGAVAWGWVHRRELRQVRFGAVVAHVALFLTVTVSYTVHAVIRVVGLGSQGDVEAATELILGSPWFGATLVTSAAWGTGLLIHVIGSVLGRGWDD